MTLSMCCWVTKHLNALKGTRNEAAQKSELALALKTQPRPQRIQWLTGSRLPSVQRCGRPSPRPPRGAAASGATSSLVCKDGSERSSLQSCEPEGPLSEPQTGVCCPVSTAWPRLVCCGWRFPENAFAESTCRRQSWGKGRGGVGGPCRTTLNAQTRKEK